MDSTTPAPHEAEEEATSHKCSLRSCRIRGAELHVCAASDCKKTAHYGCYQAYVLAKHSELQSLPELHVACTKKCHIKAARELISVNAQDDEGGRKGGWDTDGKESPSDPKTSIKILLDWWMEEGNYIRFCGKQNDGVKKFCNMLADRMTKETTSTRYGKNVLNKIQHIERSFREAHSFAESETGAGLLANDGEETFENVVKKKCPFYYNLKEVMIDCASTRSKAISYDLDYSDDDDDNDPSNSESNSPKFGLLDSAK
jgi:hypothetical protein